MFPRRHLFALALCVAGLGASVQTADAQATQPDKRIEQVEFNDVPLGDALRLLSRQAGVNIVPSSEAGKLHISLFLRDVTAVTTIDELCKANNLWYRRDDVSGIVRVMTVAEFQRDLISFREEKTQVFTLLYPNVIALSGAIADLYGDRVQFSLGSDDGREEIQNLRDRFQRFDLIDQRSQGLGIAQTGGTTVTGGLGGTGSSSGTGYSDTSSSTLGRPQMTRTSGEVGPGAATQPGEYRNLTPSQAQEITRLSGGTVTPEQFALLDAYRKSKANIYITGMRRNNTLIVRTSDAAALEDITQLIRRLDTPTPLVLLEVKVLSLDLADGFNSAFDFQFSDGSTIAGGFTSGDIVPPSSDLLSGAARRAASLALGGSGITPGALVFQVVSDSFRARMQLLEDRNRVTQLATPLLLTANNEVSRLFVGEERPIVRNISSQTVINNTIATTTPNTSIEFRPVGTTLLISPSINSDRTVTLRILQENSRIVSNGAQIPVVTATGTVQSQPVDVVSAQTLSGTIVAKDNLTMAVGGLIQDEVADVRTEVPVLGKLPMVGIFFRRQDTQRSRHELIILIRPYVLNTPAESEQISRNLIKELSIHPSAPDARGTMGTYLPGEVLRPNPPTNQQETIFRFHSVKPDDF